MRCLLPLPLSLMLLLGLFVGPSLAQKEGETEKTKRLAQLQKEIEEQEKRLEKLKTQLSSTTYSHF